MSDTPRPETVHVRLLVWGPTTADQERAIHRASQGQSRNAWTFVEIERLTGTQCPINTRDPDPKSIAADAGYGWAYIIYPADDAQ